METLRKILARKHPVGLICAQCYTPLVDTGGSEKVFVGVGTGFSGLDTDPVQANVQAETDFFPTIGEVDSAAVKAGWKRHEGKWFCPDCAKWRAA